MDNTTKFMQLAINEAEKARGKCSPNPFVGAVICKNNEVIAKGHTQDYGGDHAEVQALKQAGSLSAGADMYVTLEPCSHYGKTPPCALAIIAAGIKRVFVGIEDPNPLVAGKGIQMLLAAGIEVHTGTLAERISRQLEYFLTYISKNRPFVTLKTALSLDGKYAAEDGSSRWISNDASRKYTHKLRSQTDVILTGINTIIQDNPMLTARSSAKAKQPLRAVLDPFLAMPIDSCFAKSMHQYPSVIYCGIDQLNTQKVDMLRSLGAQIEALPMHKGLFRIADVMEHLAKMKKYSVMLETGSGVAESFLKEQLVDKCLFFYAPKIIGGSMSPLNSLGISSITDAIELKDISFNHFGDNLLICGYPQYR